MKKILATLALVLTALSASAATLNPVQLLNPAGSTSGQAIVSTGASTAPSWGNVTASALAAQAANTVIGNATGSTASPTAITVTGCNGAAQALQWTNGSGFGCNSSVATSGANTNITSLNAPALGAATATTAAASTNTTQVATTAMVNSAITSGSLAGSFTTLAASANDALLYNNSSAQSIANNTSTTITGWTKVSDRVNANFNASTGVFTAPATGYYRFDAKITYASHTPTTTNETYQLGIVANGVNQCFGTFNNESTIGASRSVEAHCVVSMTSGQTAIVQTLQTSGAAVALIGTAVYNYLSINRVP